MFRNILEYFGTGSDSSSFRNILRHRHTLDLCLSLTASLSPACSLHQWKIPMRGTSKYVYCTSDKVILCTIMLLVHGTLVESLNVKKSADELHRPFQCAQKWRFCLFTIQCKKKEKRGEEMRGIVMCACVCVCGGYLRVCGEWSCLCVCVRERGGGVFKEDSL